MPCARASLNSRQTTKRGVGKRESVVLPVRHLVTGRLTETMDRVSGDDGVKREIRCWSGYCNPLREFYHVYSVFWKVLGSGVLIGPVGFAVLETSSYTGWPPRFYVL